MAVTRDEGKLARCVSNIGSLPLIPQDIDHAHLLPYQNTIFVLTKNADKQTPPTFCAQRPRSIVSMVHPQVQKLRHVCSCVQWPSLIALEVWRNIRAPAWRETGEVHVSGAFIGTYKWPVVHVSNAISVMSGDARGMNQASRLPEVLIVRQISWKCGRLDPWFNNPKN